MGALHPSEEKLLWDGWRVWQEEIEDTGQQDGGGRSGPKPGQHITEGDRKQYQKFKNGDLGDSPGPSSP